MTNLQNDLILVGATGRLGSSILKTNSISYGICSPENPLQGKKIDNLSHPLLGSLLEIPKDKLKNPLIETNLTNRIKIIFDRFLKWLNE